MNTETFRRLFETNLYASEQSGRCLAAAPDCAVQLPGSLTLKEAVSSEEYRASFVFAKETGAIKSKDDAQKLLARLYGALGEIRRGVVWLGKHGSSVLPLCDNAQGLSGAFISEIAERLSLIIPIDTGVKFSEDGTSLCLEQRGVPFRLSTVGYACVFSNAVLALCGENAGVFSFTVRITYDDLVRCFPAGFEYSWTQAKEPLSFPLLEEYSESPILPMRFQLDLSERSGSSVLFSQEGILLATGLRTIFGERVFMETTTRGGFCFPDTPVQNSRLMMAPLGAYRVSTEDKGDIKLLCGLSGTEYFILPQLSEISFVSEKPAFADRYPAKELSIDDFVEPPPPLPLSDAAVTSWVKPCGGEYASQPAQAPYYGGSGGILQHIPTVMALPDDAPAVPMVPYGAMKKSSEQAESFEAQALSRCRAEIMAACSGSRCVSLRGAQKSTVASPSGYLVKTQGERWEKLQLAVSQGGEVAFYEPSAPLVAAFSSSGLLLLAAQEGSVPQCGISMDGWSFTLRVGADCKYNDYRNLLLVKGRSGKLYDPSAPEHSLVCSVTAWTQRSSFSSPCGDAGQQGNLANYLADYFAKAYAMRENPYFSNFADIITDENWQGFLYLNVSLKRENFPVELRGLLPDDDGEISLHHLGARVTVLKQGPSGPEADGVSSLFGLIYYRADGFEGAVMPPLSEHGFEYRPDELKVLFQNSSIARFESAAQLTIGDFMGIVPVTGGCPYNTVLLKGAYQAEDGAPSYTLSSTGESLLIFSNGPFTQAVLDKVAVSSSETKTAFNISGRISFLEKELDIWSFKGLAFSGLKLNKAKKEFGWETAALSFDLTHSDQRQGSLAEVFALTPQEILRGDKSLTPQKKGYSPIACEGLRNASFTGAWYGLRFNIKLGTTGELAGNGGINASLLLAWGGEGESFAGIALPGAIMVENVLGLSIGAARLIKKDGRLMLLLSDIALKCLGILKLPPSGSLSMSVFQGVGWFAMYKKDE